MTMRRILLILLPLACIAQETGPVSSLKLKILDLQFRVEDMGGKVEDLHIKETATEVRVEMAADILFDFDKAVLKPQAESALRQVAALIAGRGKGPVRVAGYTDAKGSDSYNQKLSTRRAEAVCNWLVAKGSIERTRLTAEGLGAKNPVAPNTKPDGSDDPEGRQRNRRVEIVISK
jgi:outer membrane protein OmpA-like peptidoglycan-associated protein